MKRNTDPADEFLGCMIGICVMVLVTIAFCGDRLPEMRDEFGQRVVKQAVSKPVKLWKNGKPVERKKPLYALDQEQQDFLGDLAVAYSHGWRPSK